MKKFLLEQGLIYLPNTREQFAARIQAESERWGRIVQDQKISLD